MQILSHSIVSSVHILTAMGYMYVGISGFRLSTLLPVNPLLSFLIMRQSRSPDVFLRPNKHEWCVM
eukprot:scaffold654_cov207-Ochromonas_danica.AAC.61